MNSQVKIYLEREELDAGHCLLAAEPPAINDLPPVTWRLPSVMRLALATIICLFLLMPYSLWAQEEEQSQGETELKEIVMDTVPEEVLQDSRLLEQQGAIKYQAGNYVEAMECYQRILSTGLESAILYYNLGNCYYKLGDIAHAILNYERALLLEPGHKDALYNLKFAQRSTVDKINVLPELFLVRWYKAFVSLLTADQWGYLSVFLFLLFLVMALFFLYATSTGVKKAGFTVAIIALVLTGCTVLFAQRQYRRVTDRNSGIVMTPSVVVRGAPDRSGTELFVVHEGLKVEVVDSLGGWYNIRIADGNEGWIQQSDLEKI